MNPGRLLVLFAIATGVVLPVRLWVVEPIYIASASMEPTLPVGRRLFADKLTPRLRRPRRGDIIVFPPPDAPGEELVKRVIGLPGESVELHAKKVLVDGKELDEPYVQHDRASERLQGDDLGPVTVPDWGLFVLGDNRDESKDSSVWTDASGERIYFIRADKVKGFVRGFY